MSSKHLFLDVYDDYMLYARKKQKNQSFTTMKYKFDLHVLPYFKDMFLEEITSKNILEWEEYILTFNFSNNQNRNLYYILSGFFEYCSIFLGFNKKIISNVGCFKPKYEDKKADYYTLDEFNQFISCIDDYVFKQFFTLMFFTGLRPGEAMALKFKDLSNGYINVSKTIESHGKREITTPKTYSSNRQVKIDRKLEKDLLKLRRVYEDKGIPFNSDLFLFGATKPLSSSTIDRRKEKACKKAGIRSITKHQFRHSHATMLVDEGIPITEVSRRLGHSKVSTTLDVYSHTDLTQEKRVFDTLNSIRLNCFTTMKYKFKSILKRIFRSNN